MYDNTKPVTVTFPNRIHAARAALASRRAGYEYEYGGLLVEAERMFSTAALIYRSIHATQMAQQCDIEVARMRKEMDRS